VTVVGQLRVNWDLASADEIKRDVAEYVDWCLENDERSTGPILIDPRLYERLVLPIRQSKGYRRHVRRQKSRARRGRS